MKQYIIIGAALLVVILLNIWQTNFLSKTSIYILTDINEIDNTVKRKDFISALAGIDALENTWNNVKQGWDIFGEHDDIEKITEHIESMKVYAKYKDVEELVNEYTLLKNMIEHVVDTEEFKFSNVL